METTARAQRARLSVFLDGLLPLLGRAERRRWGGLYVRGLLASGERKATATMATQAPDGNVQALQQFIGQSPWVWEPVRRRLAQRLSAALQPVAAWVVDDTGFPKQGTHSVGVARQYSGTLGKTGNCQVAVSLHYATGDAAVPLDFGLYLPEEWLEPERRQQAGIPEEVSFQPKWAIALELVDRARDWQVPAGVVTADAGYGTIADFRTGLAERKLPFIVAVASTTGVWPAPSPPSPSRQGRGRPRQRPQGVGAPASVQALSISWPAAQWQRITWRAGSKGPLTSRFAAARVVPSHGYQHGGAKEGPRWLLAAWPEDAPAPTDFWLADLPAETSLVELVRLAKIRWWIEQGYQQLKDELGLDHYEGRSWQGWHHHVTMTLVAFGFLTLEALAQKKSFWAALEPATDSS